MEKCLKLNLLLSLDCLYLYNFNEKKKTAPDGNQERLYISEDMHVFNTNTFYHLR